MSSGASQRVNRRLSARVACRLVVSYKTDGVWHPATGMDLSNTGCRFRLGEDLPRGVALRVRIEPPAGVEAKGAEVAGHVIWTRLEGLSYQAGVQFSEDDENLHQILAALAAPAAPVEP
jgi:hypothetical protein